MHAIDRRWRSPHDCFGCSFNFVNDQAVRYFRGKLNSASSSYRQPCLLSTVLGHAKLHHPQISVPTNSLAFMLPGAPDTLRPSYAHTVHLCHLVLVLLRLDGGSRNNGSPTNQSPMLLDSSAKCNLLASSSASWGSELQSSKIGLDS